MFHFNHVSYSYDGITADVHDINLELKPGSFHFLCGASGAGKTTLFRMAYMDLLPTDGDLLIFDKSVKTFDREDIAHTRRRMGIVFQNPNLLNHLTVRENVSLPLTLHGKPTDEQERCIDEILDWVGLGDKLNDHPNQLSGGEKSRVGIARAVVNRPKLLIADEPTGDVDEAMGRRIMHLFTELHKHGTTVLVATHDKEIVKEFGFPCLFIENGRMVKRTDNY